MPLSSNAISDQNMISFENISFSVAGRTLVKNSTVKHTQWTQSWARGENGTGKTSLFRLIYGEITLRPGKPEVE